MAPSGHAVSGGGRLLPCMFSCMPTVPVRALGFRVCTCAWDGGTAPRRYGLRLGMTRLEYNNPLLASGPPHANAHPTEARTPPPLERDKGTFQGTHHGHSPRAVRSK